MRTIKCLFGWLGVIGMSLSEMAAASVTQKSFLQSGERIVFVGDSITAAQAYQTKFATALMAVYPAGDLQIATVAAGGSTAAGQLDALKSYLSANPATIICVMFGVNDTQWSSDNGDAKEAKFLAGMEEYEKIAAAQGAKLIILRETHFSHDQKGVEALKSLNSMLDRLQNAQTKWAEAKGIPIIDVRGAYQRALDLAWKVDPEFEFTPDVVHPSSPGNAAIAIELLRAFGVGLPLAEGGERGVLQLTNPDQVRIQISDQVGTSVEESVKLGVSVQNQTKQPQRGELILVSGKQVIRQSIEVNASESKKVEVPFNLGTGEWEALPVYAAFIGDDLFSGSGTFFYSSPVQSLANGPFSADKSAFFPKEKASECPVDGVKVSEEAGKLMVEFRWKKAEFIAAQPGFKSRLGPIVNTPLDLNSGIGQPCDAVELFVDLRPDNSTGRYTSDADSNPEGILRVGLYWTEGTNGKEVKLIASPKLPEGAQLQALGDDRFQVSLPLSLDENPFAFSLAVTSVDQFNPAGGTLFRLTSGTSLTFEPMSYLRLDPKKSGRFFRFGY